jgi:la-related protein 1
MDAEGYVSVNVLANFNRVKNLTDDTAFVLESLADSQELEIKEDRIRKKEGWSTWLLPPNSKIANVTSNVPVSRDAIASRQ